MMWAITFFRGAGKYIVLAAAAVAALFAFGKSKEVKGRRKEQAKQMEETVEIVKDATDARRDPDDSGVRRFDRRK